MPMSFDKPFLSILFLAMALSGCRGSMPQPAVPAEAAPVSVRTVSVIAQDWPSGYEATGTVRARTTGVVSSKVMGYVRDLRAHVGDTVKAGQVLVVLDARDIESAYRQAEAAHGETQAALAEADNGVAAARAQAELAQTTFRRMKDLYDKKSISNQEYDEVSAKLKLADASLQMALSKRQQLDAKIRQTEEGVTNAAVMKSYAELRAPFSGTVVEKQVETGNLVTPGAPLLTVEQAGAYRLEAPVEESQLGRVRMGQKVTVVLEAFDRSLDGRVSEIVPAVDPSSRTFTVKIDLSPAAGLRSGMFGRVTFPGDARKVISIPDASVREQGQVRLVMLVEKGTARTRMVTLGRKRSGAWEVLSGLVEGDQVIAPLPAPLEDGARVEVRP
jgi:RND family efflux transporter MFP subunit